jgi:hypothetical protein
MPRESIAFVLAYGLGLGILWGALSLFLWTVDERVPGILIAPLWLIAAIGPHVNVNVYLLGTAVCTVLGLVAASAVLVIAHARGA